MGGQSGKEDQVKYRQTFETTTGMQRWYDAKYTEMGGTWHTPADECNRHLDALGVPFDPSKALLDVGCGGGHFLAEASKRVGCLGFEISEVAIRYAKQRAPQALIVKASIEYKPLEHIGFFDYVTSLGSLEHVVNLDKALDSIRDYLKPSGRWYFLVPNEKWTHDDQPNERTATNEEWAALFAAHGLATLKVEPWGDQTAFMGCRGDNKPALTPQRIDGDGLLLNIGSGQRPFAKPWINVDAQAKWCPDIVADGAHLPMIHDGQAALIVLHHVLEHYGCGEASGLILECHRMLQPGGSLLVFVPNMRALVKAWERGDMDTQLFLTNVYGAYMGDEVDRHKWGYEPQTLAPFLDGCAKWSKMRMFDWREVAGASFARDWWVTAMEVVR